MDMDRKHMTAKAEKKVQDSHAISDAELMGVVGGLDLSGKDGALRLQAMKAGGKPIAHK